MSLLLYIFQQKKSIDFVLNLGGEIIEKVREIFAERLGQLMKERKTTQQALSDKIGITRQSFSNYINAKRSPDIEILKGVADYFKVSADYLLGITDIKISDTNSHTSKVKIRKIIKRG